ncbi:MAG: hypothetical protein NZ602_06580 [Thermoguttaceae bacterium]|nr:hypothetical protein [Thermoguttaceae bacterium]MDW8036947.1 hypothetical protein [Thermoguttaceae bacterium]
MAPPAQALKWQKSSYVKGLCFEAILSINFPNANIVKGLGYPKETAPWKLAKVEPFLALSRMGKTLTVWFYGS